VGLPDEMMQGLERFNAFHEQTHKKMRKLTWQLGLGTVHVKATFDKSYELIMQPFTAAVLLPFNTEEEITFAALAECTKLPPEELDRSLIALALGKHKLLVKTPEGRTIGRDDVFRLNTKFSDRMRRVRITLPAVDDRRKVTEDVDKDRKYAIEAAIVRVMKSRKALVHSGLVTEVVQQLQRSFAPDIKAIKRSIESLIDVSVGCCAVCGKSMDIQ
jgi:Cullin family/Cullin protein neddylation domain